MNPLSYPMKPLMRLPNCQPQRTPRRVGAGCWLMVLSSPHLGQKFLLLQMLSPADGYLGALRIADKFNWIAKALMFPPV